MTANNNANTRTLPWLQHVLFGLKTANTFTHNPLAKLLSAVTWGFEKTVDQEKKTKKNWKTKGTPTTKLYCGGTYFDPKLCILSKILSYRCVPCCPCLSHNGTFLFCAHCHVQLIRKAITIVKSLVMSLVQFVFCICSVKVETSCYKFRKVAGRQ